MGVEVAIEDLTDHFTPPPMDIVYHRQLVEGSRNVAENSMTLFVAPVTAGDWNVSLSLIT